MTNQNASSAANAETSFEHKLSFRLQAADDAAWVEDLHARAFGPGRFARAAFRVREWLPVDPALSLICEADGERVGSVWMTPINVGGRNGYLLGPLATDPGFRNKGAGRFLVRQASKMAAATGRSDYVILVGDPPYYAPLGFVPATPGAIIFPGPVDPNRVLVQCADNDLAVSLAGEIAPFNA